MYSSKAADVGEDADYDKVIARYKSEGLGDNWGEYMKIVSVNVRTLQDYTGTGTREDCN